MFAIILDILIVLIAVIGIIVGVRQGFVRFFFLRFRKLTAAILALLLAKPVGRLITDGFLSDKLTSFILSASKLTDVTNAASAEELLNSVPIVVRLVAQAFHYDLPAVAQRAFEGGDGMYYTIIQELSYPLASAIAVIVSWIVLFLLFRLFLRLLLHITGNLFELPVIKQINALLGAIVGLLFNAAIVWLLCKATVWIVSLPAFSDVSILQTFSIENTHIAKYVYHFNPLAFILSVNPLQ